MRFEEVGIHFRGLQRGFEGALKIPFSQENPSDDERDFGVPAVQGLRLLEGGESFVPPVLRDIEPAQIEPGWKIIRRLRQDFPQRRLCLAVAPPGEVGLREAAKSGGVIRPQLERLLKFPLCLVQSSHNAEHVPKLKMSDQGPRLPADSRGQIPHRPIEVFLLGRLCAMANQLVDFDLVLGIGQAPVKGRA